MSRIFKGAAATVVALSFATLASANCGSSMYCGQSAGHSTLPALSSWTGAATGASYAMHGNSSRYSPSTSYAPSASYTSNSYAPTSYTNTMSSYEADATYGTGSISESYSSYDTQNFHGSTSSVQGLGYNESLQATNCPTAVLGAGEGKVVGCYNVVKPVPQTTYYRVVRPVVYVRYPVPVAVPYTSPCMTVKHYSRYGDWHTGGRRAGCR